MCDSSVVSSVFVIFFIPLKTQEIQFYTSISYVFLEINGKTIGDNYDELVQALPSLSSCTAQAILHPGISV